MSSIFNSKPPGPALVAELKARGSTSINQWHASKVAWVHIQSFASSCDRNTLGRGQIMSNSNSKDNYTSNYERPLPGVKSVKVTKQGELGTTRKCSIELQAWTDEQLNEIAKCYFLPGMSVRVQFGWNIDADGAKTTGPITKMRSDSRANCLIFAITEQNTANYDGFQGKITNYSYSLNTDGGWDITLEIVSAANLMAETKVESTTNNCECTAEVGGEKVNLSNSDILVAFLKAVLDEDNLKSLMETLGLSPAEHSAAVKFHGLNRTALGEPGSNFFADWLGMDSVSLADGTTEFFISVKAFHTILNYYSLPSAGRDFIFGKIDTKDVYLSIQNQNLAIQAAGSSDPRVCLLPGARNPVIAEPTTPSAFTFSGGEKVVELDKILINTIFIMKTIKELSDQADAKKGLSLQTLLSSIYTSINTKIGNLWNLEIVDASNSTSICDEDREEPTLSIVDTSQSGAPVETWIEPVGYDLNKSIVRDFTLQTKLTDSMKSMALYAYIPSQKGKDPCQDQYKAFTQRNSVKNLALPKSADSAATKGKDIPCDMKSGDVECKTSTKSPYTKLYEARLELVDGITDENVTALESARSGFMGAESQARSATAPACNTLLPFEWSFTLDGIGGFKFGQYVMHPRIPEGVRKDLLFQVTSVEHDISENDWKTTVNTIVRYRKQ